MIEKRTNACQALIDLLDSIDNEATADYMVAKGKVETLIRAITGFRADLSAWHPNLYRIEPERLHDKNPKEDWLFAQIYDRKPVLRQSISAATLDFLAHHAEHKFRLRNRRKGAISKMTPLVGQTEFGFVDELPKPEGHSGRCPWSCKSKPKYMGKAGREDRWRCPDCRQEWKVLDHRRPGRGEAAS